MDSVQETLNHQRNKIKGPVSSYYPEVNYFQNAKSSQGRKHQTEASCTYELAKDAVSFD